MRTGCLLKRCAQSQPAQGDVGQIRSRAIGPQHHGCRTLQLALKRLGRLGVDQLHRRSRSRRCDWLRWQLPPE